MGVNPAPMAGRAAAGAVAGAGCGTMTRAMAGWAAISRETGRSRGGAGGAASA